VVDIKHRRLICAGRPITLSPATFAFAAWLAERAARFGAEKGAVHWSRVDWREFLAIYAALPGQGADRVEALRKRLATDAGDAFFRDHSSRLRRAMEDALGAGAAPYQLRGFGRRPFTRFGFGIPASAITISGTEES
jgi:hypothetical protein